MEREIQNRNLFLAERLLQMIADERTEKFTDGAIWVGEDVIADLSPEEIRRSLEALVRREVIELCYGENHLYDLSSPLGAHVIVDEARTRDFCMVAKNVPSGLDMGNKQWVGEILAALHALTRARLDEKNTVRFSQIGREHIKSLEWVADYSGIIEVVYEPEVDADVSDGRTWIVPAGYHPKAVVVSDKHRLTKLYQEMRKKVGGSYEKPANALLRTTPEIEWKCISCRRLFERITTRKQLVDHLVDFTMFMFKTCYKCRGHNYFSVNPKGEIEFLMGKKRPSYKHEDFYDQLLFSLRKQKRTEDGPDSDK